MKRYLLIFVCGLLTPALAGAQTERTVHERVYVQTDKPLYLAGELMWLKLLLTDEAARPFDGSKVGYVELLDPTTAQVQAKLELTNGVGEGWMMLPLTLPTGNYRLVGYTRYMQNEGEKVFFEKIVPVVNTFSDEQEVALSADSLPAAVEAKADGGLTLRPDRQTYSTRSAGQVEIGGLPANLHTLSVSIAGREIIPLIRQAGIRQWQNQLTATPVGGSFPVAFIPEYEGHILYGKLINITTGMNAGAEGLVTILGFTGNQTRLFSGQVDNQGNVCYYTKHISGTHELVTNVLSSGIEIALDEQADLPDQPTDNLPPTTTPPSDEVQYRVDIKSPFATHTEKGLPRLHLNPAWNNYLLGRSVGLQVLHGFTADSMSNIIADEALFQWKPSTTYILDEYTRFTTMEEIVIEFIPSLRFRRINGKRHLAVLTEDRMGFTIGNSLVLLDGIPIIDHEHIFRYDPLKVERIEVFRGKYLFGGQLFNGIASFKTYHHDYPGLTVDPSTQFFDYEGTQARRLFYAPSYPTEAERNSRVPDFRHTLLWNPTIQSEGKPTVTIPFTTSDLKGEFIVTVEGLTLSGEPVSGTVLIRVD